MDKVIIAALCGLVVHLATCVVEVEVDFEAPIPTAIEWGACTAHCSADGELAYDLTYSLAGWRCTCREAWAQEES